MCESSISAVGQISNLTYILLTPNQETQALTCYDVVMLLLLHWPPLYCNQSSLVLTTRMNIPPVLSPGKVFLGWRTSKHYETCNAFLFVLPTSMMCRTWSKFDHFLAFSIQLFIQYMRSGIMLCTVAWGSACSF